MWLNGVMPRSHVIWSVTPDQTNSPYIRDLARAIETAGWTVETLSLLDLIRRPRALVHIQWPEHVSRGPRPVITLLKHIRAALIIATLRARKHHVILTAHNRAPHGKSDAFDAWFRRAAQRLSAATIVLVPEHEDLLRKDDALHETSKVVTIPHPTHPPAEPLDLLPEVERRQLLILGQIHPYHRILELVNALDTDDNTRPVLVAGGVGDPVLFDELEQLATTREWLTVRPGFADDDVLGPILAETAALVSLQRNAFNSGGPFYALPRGLPVLVSAGPQANDLIRSVGEDWVFPVPHDVSTLNTEELNAFLDRPRGDLDLDRFDVTEIARQHIELYELLRF